MIALLRNEASRYSISIHAELTEDLPKVMADRVQLQQVFMNLMLNAIEAINDTDTAGKLTIKSQRNHDGQLLISVRDTGKGLPPEQADKLFDAFFTTNHRVPAWDCRLADPSLSHTAAAYAPPQTLTAERRSTSLYPSKAPRLWLRSETTLGC